MFQDIDIGNTCRNLSRQITPEIAEFASNQQDLFSSQRGALCDYSPVNFNGALILGQILPRLVRIFAEVQQPVPEELQTPYEIYSNVGLTLFDKTLRDYKETNLVAENVLYKKNCGQLAGLVLKGPLTGLLLSRQIGVDPAQSLCVNRIYNDEKAATEKRPYPPYIDQDQLSKRKRGDRTSFTWKKKTPYQQITAAVFAEFNRAYSESIAGLTPAVAIPFDSDILLSLCDQNNIPFDISNFHYTRRRDIRDLDVQ